MKKKLIPIITIVVIILGIAYYVFQNSESEFNKKYNEYNKTEGAVLIDLRSLEDYQEGHVDGSISIPYVDISNIEVLVLDKSTPIYLYSSSSEECSAGKEAIQKLGYTKIIIMGAVSKYEGKLVKENS